MKSIIKECIRQARKHYFSGNHPEEDCFIHYSFVIERNKIVGYSTNQKGSSPIEWGYNHYGKIHSEYAAYKKMRGIIKGEFYIVNIRLNRQGELKNSCPCACCCHYLSLFNCKLVYYSISENHFGKVKIK